MAAALSLSALIFAGALIGFQIDGMLGSAPIGVGAGVILGTVIGIAQVVVVVRASDKES